MGYDFMFLQFKKKIKKYPFEPSREFDFFNEVKKLPDVQTLTKYIQYQKNFKENGANKDGTVWYWWDTPDGGSLDIQLSPDRLAIHIDTHAHWKYVLELLVLFQQNIDNLVVLDKQTMVIYDKKSFRTFVAESYDV